MEHAIKRLDIVTKENEEIFFVKYRCVEKVVEEPYVVRKLAARKKHFLGWVNKVLDRVQDTEEKYIRDDAVVRVINSQWALVVP